MRRRVAKRGGVLGAEQRPRPFIGTPTYAQLVEQLFRKQQVAGSSPAVGSRESRSLTRDGPVARLGGVHGID